jgi:hypothetical protein
MTTGSVCVTGAIVVRVRLLLPLLLLLAAPTARDKAELMLESTVREAGELDRAVEALVLSGQDATERGDRESALLLARDAEVVATKARRFALKARKLAEHAAATGTGPGSPRSTGSAGD